MLPRRGSHGFLCVLVFKQASGGEDVFFRIGTLCGMALHNGCIAPFAFPRALYKKLLGRAPTLENLEELLPDVGRYGPGRPQRLLGASAQAGLLAWMCARRCPGPQSGCPW